MTASFFFEIKNRSNRLLAVAELDSDTWVAEGKRIRGKKLPLTAAGVYGLWDEYTRTARQRDPDVGEHREKLGKTCLCQDLPVDALRQVWQYGAAMIESEQQFSFTRAASSASGCAKSNSLPVCVRPRNTLKCASQRRSWCHWVPCANA